MSGSNHIPNTVNTSLNARLSPFRAVSQEPAPEERSGRMSLANDLKLLFAALGAGGRVVPLGDNSRTARILSEYAAALREH